MLRKNVFAIIIAFFSTQLATCPQLTFAQGQPMTLQGGVQHSEHLGAVSDDLMPGQTYKGAATQSAGSSNFWYIVPDWLTGKWHTDTGTQTYDENYTCGDVDNSVRHYKDKGDYTYGYFADKSGQVWDFDDGTKSDSVEQRSRMVYHIYSIARPVAHTADSITFLTRRTSVFTDKVVHNILETQQQEIIATLTRADGGYTETDSMKVFDTMGRPMELMTLEESYKLIAPFDAKANLSDSKRVANFRNFLLGHGMDILVPDYASPASAGN